MPERWTLDETMVTPSGGSLQVHHNNHFYQVKRLKARDPFFELAVDDAMEPEEALMAYQLNQPYSSQLNAFLLGNYHTYGHAAQSAYGFQLFAEEKRLVCTIHFKKDSEGANSKFSTLEEWMEKAESLPFEVATFPLSAGIQEPYGCCFVRTGQLQDYLTKADVLLAYEVLHEYLSGFEATLTDEELELFETSVPALAEEFWEASRKDRVASPRIQLLDGLLYGIPMLYWPEYFNLAGYN